MNVKRSMGLLMMAASLVPMLLAQGSFWNTPQAYLGQAPPLGYPKSFCARTPGRPGHVRDGPRGIFP